MGELLVWVGVPLTVLAAAIGLCVKVYGRGSQSGYAEGYDAGLRVGHERGFTLGLDTARLEQSTKDSARARKAAATRKQRAAIVELGNSEV